MTGGDDHDGGMGAAVAGDNGSHLGRVPTDFRKRSIWPTRHIYMAVRAVV